MFIITLNMICIELNLPIAELVSIFGFVPGQIWLHIYMSLKDDVTPGERV